MSWIVLVTFILELVKPWLGEGKVFEWLKSLLEGLFKGGRAFNRADDRIPNFHAATQVMGVLQGSADPNEIEAIEDPSPLDKADAAEALLREALGRTRMIHVLKRSLLRAMIERVPAAIKEGKTKLSKKDGGEELSMAAAVAKTRKAEWE